MGGGGRGGRGRWYRKGEWEVRGKGGRYMYKYIRYRVP